jgi:hypothetical protein
MKTLPHFQSIHLEGIHGKIEASLKRLEDPTHETAEKAITALFPSSSSDTRALIPFTGYYAISSGSNAFLSIDTSELYITHEITKKITVSLTLPAITINVSLHGETPKSYPFDSSCSFDGKTLIIPNVLTLDLTRVNEGGPLATLSGTINDASVTGSTYFNPVELPVFSGTYKSLKTGEHNLVLRVANSFLMFDFESGDGLQNIPVFTYNPAMYVVMFEHAGEKYVLMLGTAARNGLACFITHNEINDFAVTIP